MPKLFFVVFLTLLSWRADAGTLLLTVPSGTLPGMGGVEVYRLDDGTMVASGLSDTVQALAMDGFGNVYEADAGGTIYKIDALGAASIFSTSAVTGETDPVDLMVNQGGSLYLLGRSNQSLQQLSIDGATALTVASGLSNPSSMALDGLTGNVYVTEADAGRVIEVTPTLSTSVFLSDLQTPTGITVDPVGAVFVADSRGILRASGGTLSLWTPATIGGSTLTFTRSPEGLTQLYGISVGEVTTSGLFSISMGAPAGVLVLNGSSGGGNYAIMAAPEPDRALLFALAVMSCVLRRRRSLI